MAYSMFSLEDEATQKAKAEEEKLAAEKTALAEKTAAEEAALLTAKETTAREAADHLNIKELRAAMEGKLFLSEEELKELAKTNAALKTERDARDPKDATARTGSESEISYAAASGVTPTEEAAKLTKAPEAVAHDDRHADSLGAVAGLTAFGAATNWMSKEGRESGLEQDAGERRKLVTDAESLMMAAKDEGDQKAVDYARSKIGTNATKAEIETAMAYLAAAEQFTDKDIKRYDAKGNLISETKIESDGNPATSDVSTTTYGYDDSQSNIVTDMIAGAMTGGRGGRRGGHQGNNAMEKALDMVALAELAGGNKEQGVLAALLTGATESRGDPFSLSSPDTPNRQDRGLPGLGLFA